MPPRPDNLFALNRRAFLGRTASGLGGLALAHLLAAEGQRASGAVAIPSQAINSLAAHPLAPKAPHHPPRARAVICLFQHGGPSQMDLFDPKPELTRWNGKEYPHKDLEVHFDKQAGKL